VALSLDGNTALIGGPLDNADRGAAWVFVRSGEVWVQTAELTARKEIGKAFFGTGVALSAGAGTALIGGLGDRGPRIGGFGIGAAWVFAVPPPKVTKVSPTKGPAAGGTKVIIKGKNFGGASAVKFGSTNASSFKVTAPTSITAFSPAAVAGTVDVTVANGGGASPMSAKDQFTFTPAVTGVSPNAGSTAGGTTVTVSGSGFAPGSGATTITFGATAATSVNCASTTTCTAVTPAHGAQTVDVSATVSGITSPREPPGDQFTFLSAPTVTGLNPNEGQEAGGTSVNISGTRLSGASAVSFGSTPAAGFTVNSASSITATSPPGAGIKDVTVTTSGGTSATGTADQFTYVPPPSVAGVTPNQGPEAGGTSVVISGSNFTGASAVKFGPTNATIFTVDSSGSISAVSPAGSGTVDVTVSTPGGTSASSNADHFSYLTLPAAASTSTLRLRAPI
jgi:hypothetical protein